MRAVVCTAPGAFQVTELADLVHGPGEVMVRPLLAGVCGTDVHIHDGGFFSRFPLTPGHEILGEVLACGDGVDGLPPGLKVVVDNASACGRCPECGRDEALFCRNFRSLGVNAPGGFAEQVISPANKVFPVGDIPDELAVLAEPLACAIHGMDVLGLKPGADVVMLGSGTTGLLLAQLLIHGGAGRLTVAGPTAFKLALAKQYGVDRVVQIQRGDAAGTLETLAAMAPGGYDVAIDATGAAALVQLLPQLVRPNGTVLVYGMCEAEDTVAWNPYDIFRRQLTIKGSFAQVNCFDRSLAMLRSGRVRAEGLVTHRFPLGEYGQAVQAVRADPSCLKAVVTP